MGVEGCHYGIVFLTLCCANRITLLRMTYCSRKQGIRTSMPRSSDAFSSRTRFFISGLVLTNKQYSTPKEFSRQRQDDRRFACAGRSVEEQVRKLFDQGRVSIPTFPSCTAFFNVLTASSWDDMSSIRLGRLDHDAVPPSPYYFSTQGSPSASFCGVAGLLSISMNGL